MGFIHPHDDVRCDHCDRPGEGYIHEGVWYSGLIAYEGECVCPQCADRKIVRDYGNPPIVPVSRSRFW